MNPTSPAYNIDWVFSSTSDVHVANHRDWFTKYTPFTTEINPAVFNDDAGMKVKGTGEVALCVETDSPSKKHRTLVLHDVLHAPGSVCNIIGYPMINEYNVISDFGSGCHRITHLQNGACYGLLDNCKLLRLLLKGYQPDQTSLDKNTAYVIRATWFDEERARWEEFKRQKALDAPMTNGHAQDSGKQSSSVTKSSLSPPLTKSETKWLKEKFDGEFKFLRMYNLSIYKEEDRDEGRRLLRAFIVQDDDSEEDRRSMSSFERDLERDPTSHAADYHFSGDEQDWIKKHFGHATNFLMTYELKFYDDEDCQEGKAIVQAFMEDSDEDAGERILVN